VSEDSEIGLDAIPSTLLLEENLKLEVLEVEVFQVGLMEGTPDCGH
jgi:hypothetical protein